MYCRILSGFLILTANCSSIAADTLLFNPVADVTISRGETDAEGAKAKLEVDSSPEQSFLLKFTVTGVAARSVVDAKLHLYNINPSNHGGTFYPVSDNGWSEQDVIWDSQPPAGAPFAQLGAVSAGTWYQIDVTPLIDGDGTYSLLVASPAPNGADYASKEAVGNAPRLVVTVAGDNTDNTSPALSPTTRQSLSVDPQQTSPIAAFPGAEGYGAQARGGRGGRVIEVTNLWDDGPGSLREALLAEGPRMVVFRVSGTIFVKSRIRIRNPYITIAGQTAPGDGILIRGGRNRATLLAVSTHDVVIRHLRLRNGSGDTDGSGTDNLAIHGGHDIVIDHVSMSWATDENNSLWQIPTTLPMRNITIQRSLIAEGLENHSNGLLVSGAADYSDPDNPVEDWKKITGISIHHNLFAHNSHRNPRIATAGAKVINNVVYNWRTRIGSTEFGSVLDYVNNYAKIGPILARDLRDHPDYIRRILMHHEHVNGYTGERYPSDPSIYTAGNIVEPGILTDPNADNWVLWRLNYSEPRYQSLPSSFRRYIPLPEAAIPIRTESAYTAYESVLDDVGANQQLHCDGSWLDSSDEVDLRIIGEVLGDGGLDRLATSPWSAGGGYPYMPREEPCPDSDRDGMPDEWELIYDFNPDDAADGPADADGDGYTNIEEFLNGTRPTGS